MDPTLGGLFDSNPFAFLQPGAAQAGSDPFATGTAPFQQMPFAPQAQPGGTGDPVTALAYSLGQQGISPSQFLQNPSVATPPPAGPTTLGESLTNGAPPSAGQTSGTEAQAQASGVDGIGKRLQDTLSGLKAPAAPVAQKVSTPSVPHGGAGAVKGGELLALLQTLIPQTAQGGRPLYLSNALGR